MSTARFRELHDAQNLLLLPNAWDAGSARLTESLGAKAVATTSAGLAWSHGYPDGDALGRESLLSAVKEIARAISVPLSVDIEGGYSDDPGEVAELAATLAGLGVAGINLEDGTAEPSLLALKIQAIKERLDAEGSELFINARTDVYLRGLASGEAAVKEVVDRAETYRTAGMDGLFVPGLADPAAIQDIAAAVHPTPLNLMLVPSLAENSELYRWGVRRLSAGSAIAQASLHTTSHLTSAFLNGSAAELSSADSLDYGTLNGLFG